MLLRVCDAHTGHRYTTAESVVAADPDRYVVLDTPALDANGRPLPPDTTPAPAEATATEAAESIEAHEEAM
jgi:hypothetical protein